MFSNKVCIETCRACFPLKSVLAQMQMWRRSLCERVTPELELLSGRQML